MERSNIDLGALPWTEPKGGGPAAAAPGQRRFGVTGMTCGSCVRRVEEALLNVTGVSSARAHLSERTVDVAYDTRLVTLAGLQEALEAAGYGLNELLATGGPQKTATALTFRDLAWPLAAGTAAAALLAGLYVAIVGLVQGLDHALDLITGDWYFVIPIVLGFGAQVGLFVFARTRLRRRLGGATKALTGAGTGTSTVSMVACCTHHLADVLPVLGLSGAALFLNDYRGPLMALGIISNAAGIVWMTRMIRVSGRHAQSTDARTPSAAS